jgi:hypothetical protein
MPDTVKWRNQKPWLDVIDHSLAPSTKPWKACGVDQAPAADLPIRQAMMFFCFRLVVKQLKTASSFCPYLARDWKHGLKKSICFLLIMPSMVVPWGLKPCRRGMKNWRLDNWRGLTIRIPFPDGFFIMKIISLRICSWKLSKLIRNQTGRDCRSDDWIIRESDLLSYPMSSAPETARLLSMQWYCNDLWWGPGRSSAHRKISSLLRALR